jgi:hypothetical protein
MGAGRGRAAARWHAVGPTGAVRGVGRPTARVCATLGCAERDAASKRRAAPTVRERMSPPWAGADKFAPPGERDAGRTRGGTPARLSALPAHRAIRARPGTREGRRPSRRMQAPTTVASRAPLQRCLLSMICSSTHAGGLERDARAAVRGRAAAAAARSDSSPALAYLNPRKPPPPPSAPPKRPSSRARTRV